MYVKGRDKYPEIVRIIKGANEKHQWGETWHTDVNYNVKPTKVIVLKLIKIPPIGGDTMFSNMELAWNILDEKIKEKIKNKQKRLDFTSRCQWIENVLAIWGNRRVIYQV